MLVHDGTRSLQAFVINSPEIATDWSNFFLNMSGVSLAPSFAKTNDEIEQRVASDSELQSANNIGVSVPRVRWVAQSLKEHLVPNINPSRETPRSDADA
jgi:hypothetical protein